VSLEVELEGAVVAVDTAADVLPDDDVVRVLLELVLGVTVFLTLTIWANVSDVFLAVGSSGIVVCVSVFFSILADTAAAALYAATTAGDHVEEK